MSDDLFPVPDCLSPRLEWIRRNRILTHDGPDCEPRWLAVHVPSVLEDLDLTREEQADIGLLMAGYCRLLDDAGLLHYASTEDEALSKLAKAHGLKLWNEENPL